MAMKDTLFTQPISKMFEFDASVAAVFDDMLERSVPFYKEAMQLTSNYALRVIKEGSRVYDLGCSTATMLLEIERQLSGKRAELIGIDSAASMIEQAKKKLQVYNSSITLEQGDILNYDYRASDLFISNYTLQFIRPIYRDGLMKRVADSLNKEGVFLFSEKVISEHKWLNKEMIDIYHTYKKERGYSEYEIMQKREALENVLVPYTIKENIAMALRSGFCHCETIFQWNNFATFIAIK